MSKRFFYTRSESNVELFKVDNFLFVFYLSFLLISLSGYLFIKFVPVRPLAYIVYLLYTFFIVSGAYIGLRAPKITYRKFVFIRLESFIAAGILFCLLLVILEWKLIIDYFGSLRYIINGAYIVRVTQIGKSSGIIPITLSYPLSLIFAFFCLSLAIYGYSNRIKYGMFSIICFVIIVLMDLTVFGRIGIVFAVFSFIGYLFIFKKKIITFKRLLVILGFFGIISLPRLIRGSFDNFRATLKDITPFFRYKIPAYLNFLVVIFVYYFTSLFALSEYLSRGQDKLTLGKRVFTPIYNIVVRIIGAERQSLIDLQAHVPFKTNIYTIIKEILSDFSFVGLLVIPLFFGLCLGLIFKKEGLFFRALQIYMIGWIFYTPIYNVFSFGGFLISFTFLLVLAYFFNPLERTYRL